MWKSQHLEFGTPPSTSLMKRKSESLEKYNTPPRPLRRSDSGRESLYSSSSCSEQCAELNLSESKMNKEKKRKKHKNLTQVTMESEKAEVNLESVVVKRKKMTGRSFKSLFKSKHKKETVPVIITEELALSQSEKLLNYQRTEEQVQLVYSKMQYLKRIHSPCSLNTIDSGRDHLLAEEDIDQKTSIVDEGKSPFSSFKLKNVKMTIEEDSAIEENYEGHILLQQKLALTNKGARSEIGILINKIQKKCDKRMKKLIQNQKGQIQEFHQIWEEKRLKLEKDHKLESAIIRSIFSEGSARMDKLKLLDDKFAKKVEENNLLKDVQLKDLEAEQSAARNEERRKAAHWLAEAKACCSSEVRAGSGPRSFGSQSEEVAGCSQSSTHILGTKDVVPFSRQHGENKNPSRSLQGNDIAPSDASVCATSEEVGCIAPIGNPNNFISTDPQNEVGIMISERSMLAVVERLNQPKHFGTGESICLNLPVSGERLHGEMQSVELNKDIPPEVPETVPNEIVDYANPVELSNNTSNKGFGEGDAIGLPDALVNQRDGTDETTIGGLALAGQILEPSEQTKASPHRCALLLPQVPADQIHQGLVSAEIQDQGAQAVEKQNTFPFEVAASEQVDTVTILQSNIELQDRDEPAIETLSTSQIEVATSEIFNTVTPEESSIKLQDRDAPVVNDQVTLQSEVANSELVASLVTPLQSDIDAPAIENCEQLHLESIDVSPSCNQFSSIELESQNQRDGTDETTIGGLALAGQILEPSDQTKASPHHCALLLPQVPEDQIHRGLVSAEIQDQGSQAVEKQNTFPFEVAASEEVDTVTILQSHIELQDLDEPAIETQSTSRIEVATSEIFNTVTPEESSIKPQDRGAPVVKDQVTLQSELANSELVATVTPVQSNIGAPAIENCEQLLLESIDVSPSCNQFSSIELESQIHNLGRNSSRTAETEVPSHEPASQLGENLELQSNHLDMGSESQFAQETSFEMSASSQNNVAVAQAGASTIELPHQAVQQLGVRVGHLSGSSYLFSHPSHEVASLNYPSLLAEPLQNELEKIRKETEQLQKSREDMISRLKSDCEKEIQEIITEVHNKYELKIQDAEAKYSLKKNRLDKNQNKVLMNKLLAEAFNSDCLDLWSSGLPEMQQAIPSRSMQHLHQLSLQHLVRPPPATPACQPAVGLQIASPNLQAMQQLSLPHSTRLCPVTVQNFTARPVQATQHAMALSFGTTSRTPFISALSPTGNLCFGGEMRSSAPHLQAFRPGTASSMPVATFPSISRHLPQLLPSQPLLSPPPAVPSTSQNRPQHQGELTALWNPSLSALELLMDVGHWPHIPGNRISSRFPEISSTFDSLGQSYLATPGNVQGNQTSSAVATNAICLSDDD